jgi:nucleoside transporter
MGQIAAVLFAQGDAMGDPATASVLVQFGRFLVEHWQFCLLHFLEFAIWGAWYVVLGNFLSARGFSRTDIGRIYSTMAVGAIISPLFVGAIADRYFNTEIIIGILHLMGAALLVVMSRTRNPRPFYWITLLYALAYSPTLSLVNSIIFAHDGDLFAGQAGSYFPWIRVFGTLGWIAAGLSHKVILAPGKPVNERPLLLAAVLSLLLGVFAFQLPATPPTSTPDDAATLSGALQQAVQPFLETAGMLSQLPVFFGVSLIIAMAMAIYFAFAALFLEKSGITPNNVGPVMTLGQAIEIFFMLSLPWFLGPNNEHIRMVLTIGIAAWAARFGLFAVGKPLPLLLLGVALHGICFDFFFAAGFIYVAAQAPAGLDASAQSLYGVFVYGLGLYIGTEGSGRLNQYFSRTETAASGEVEVHTQWRKFWLVPFIVTTIALVLFAIAGR